MRRYLVAFEHAPGKWVKGPAESREVRGRKATETDLESIITRSLEHDERESEETCRDDDQEYDEGHESSDWRVDQ